MKPLPPKLHEILRSDVMRAGQKYLLVGGASALTDWALFAFILYALEFHYLLAGALSFTIVTAANYYMSAKFVFGTGRRSLRQRVTLLYVVSIVGLFFNLGLLTLGIDLLELHPMVAKILATGIVFGWNFSLRYYFIFQR